jgi:hypothetical protein
MATVPFSDLRCEQCRLTLFLAPGTVTHQTDWWEAAAEAAPDETKFLPKKGSGETSGTFGHGKLILKLEPGRIDWVLVPPEMDASQINEGQLPSLGVAAEVLQSFATVTEKWLQRNDIPETNRVAFGAVFVHPEPTKASGYERLPAYLPVRLDPDSSDFLYQVNVPTTESVPGIEGLRLNRLSKWSVARFGFLALRYTGVNVEPVETPEAFALRIEVDINTVATYRESIPASRLVDVYRELVAAGRAVTTNGIVVA